MESDNDIVHIMSSNDDNMCVESQGNDEYNESINNDNMSFECEEIDSTFSESEDCNQHKEEKYKIKNEFGDN